MKFILQISIIVFCSTSLLTACGKKKPKAAAAPQKTQSAPAPKPQQKEAAKKNKAAPTPACDIQQAENGDVIIKCGDKTATIKQPKSESCTLAQDETAVVITCGENSATIEKPKAGQSCSLNETETEIAITCADQTVTIEKNMKTGEPKEQDPDVPENQ